MRHFLMPLASCFVLVCSSAHGLGEPSTGKGSTQSRNSKVSGSPEPTTFALSETNATALSSQDLVAGTKLTVSASDLKSNETLLLNKCGALCNTSKVMSAWRPSDLPSGSHYVLSITEPGSYYLWIQQIEPDGSMGPVFGTSTKAKGDTTTINYASGTTVSVTVKKP